MLLEHANTAIWHIAEACCLGLKWYASPWQLHRAVPFTHSTVSRGIVCELSCHRLIRPVDFMVMTDINLLLCNCPLPLARKLLVEATSWQHTARAPMLGFCNSHQLRHKVQILRTGALPLMAD